MEDLSLSYLSPQQLANLLGVSTSTVRRWESEGAIKSIRTKNGQRRYTADTVTAAKIYQQKVAQDRSLTSKAVVAQQRASVGATGPVAPTEARC